MYNIFRYHDIKLFPATENRKGDYVVNITVIYSKMVADRENFKDMKNVPQAAFFWFYVLHLSIYKSSCFPQEKIQKPIRKFFPKNWKRLLCLTYESDILKKKKNADRSELSKGIKKFFGLCYKNFMYNIPQYINRFISCK